MRAALLIVLALTPLTSTTAQERPPVKLIPYDRSPPKTDRDASYEGLVVDGDRISVGDIFGFHRDDPVLGYTPQENVVSLNGWWQSNNIGARKRRDTPPSVEISVDG